MDRKIETFTDLYAWQEAHQLALVVYRATKSFPKGELFSLVNQMRRAAVSVTSNIAEGFARKSYKEKAQFYYIAKGSISEIKNQLILSRDLQYLDEAVFDECIHQAERSDRILQGLVTKTRSRIGEVG